MAGRPGFFGGVRQGDAPVRDAEFGFASQEGSPFIRLGESRSGRDDGFGGTPGFDPIWGTLGAPVAQAGDPWRVTSEQIETGPIVDVEIFGECFQIAGQICTGQFPRLSDYLNMQQGFIQVREGSMAPLGQANPPDPDAVKGTLWVRLAQIVLVVERAAIATHRPGAPVVQKERRKATIVAPGFSMRGNLHIHTHGSMKQFLESPDPHFLPLTELTIRQTGNPALVSRYPFALVNREQLISLLDEPANPADEATETEADREAEMPLHRRWGAA
jgi:hypothetical protein